MINLSVLIFCDFQFWTLFHFFSGSGRTSSRPTICCSGQPVGHRSSPTSHPRNVETFLFWQKRFSFLVLLVIGSSRLWATDLLPCHIHETKTVFLGEICLCDLSFFCPHLVDTHDCWATDHLPTSTQLCFIPWGFLFLVWHPPPFPSPALATKFSKEKNSRLGEGDYPPPFLV